MSTRERIESAMAQCRARGYKIAPDGWGLRISTFRTGFEDGAPGETYLREAHRDRDEPETLCALGALLYVEVGLGKPVHGRDLEAVAAVTLGVPRAWINAFIRGFDGEPETLPLDAYHMGRDCWASRSSPPDSAGPASRHPPGSSEPNR